MVTNLCSQGDLLSSLDPAPTKEFFRELWEREDGRYKAIVKLYTCSLPVDAVFKDTVWYSTDIGKVLIFILTTPFDRKD